MNDIQISVAQGKKEFTKIIRDSSQSEGNFIITKRGKPTAVIMSYEAYQRLRRRALYAELMGLRKTLAQSGITAYDVYRKSRRQLEEAQ